MGIAIFPFFQHGSTPKPYNIMLLCEIWPKTRPGPLALNAARPGLKRGPAAHTVLRNRNATTHAASKRRPPPGVVYCEVKLATGSLDKTDNTGVNTVLNAGLNTGVNTRVNNGDNT